MIPYGRHNITQSDIDSVVEILKSDFLTQGPAVISFEKAIAEYVDSEYAVACNSATSALHIACLALQLKPGDYVWTSPISFVASSNCALYCQAKVDFVDIDPRTYNISVEELERKLEKAEQEGRLPKIVIPVHFAGQSCDMEKIKSLSDKYGFSIIEDASHAIGGTYRNSKLGSCKYSDITIFSFHPVKIITTGEGGVAVTNDQKLATTMNMLRSHGITRDKKLFANETEGPWYYEQLQLGFNYRLTDIQAALGISQLKKLDHFLDKRKTLVANYDQELETLSVTTPWVSEGVVSAWHLYVIKVQSHRNEIFKKMKKCGIGVNVHYIPIYWQPYYKNLGFKRDNFPNAEDYYKHAITIPLYPDLTISDQDYIIDTIKELIS